MRNILCKFSLFLFLASFPTLAWGQVTLEENTPRNPGPAIDQTESAPSPVSVAPHPRIHRGPAFFHSAHRRPLTPQDVATREAVELLGVDRHRFVRCELKDGSSSVGGILNIERDGIYLSQGIMGQKKIYY
jgi:hypothetical protein